MRNFHMILLLVLSCVSVAGSHHVYCSPCSCQWFNNGTMQMDCENTNLDYIPKPPTVGHKVLKLSVYFVGNNLPLLTKENLSNLTAAFNLYFLSLRNSGIRNITRDAFSRSKYIRKLDLSGNNVSQSDLGKAFSGLSNLPSLRLNISSMGLRQPLNSLLHHLRYIPVCNITLRNSSLSSFPHEAIKFLNVRYFDIGHNDISKLSLPENFTYLPLRRLIMSDNKFHSFPIFCQNDRSSHFPGIVEINLKYCDIRVLNRERYECLFSVEKLYLDGNLFRTLKKNDFAELPNLLFIGLSQAGCAMKTTEGYVFNNTALKEIFFRKNHLWFNGEVNLSIFHGCTTLELLDLNDNVFQTTKQWQFDTVFKDLRSLKTLVLGRGGLYFIPQTITRDLINLRSLSLYGNNIPNMNDGAFDNLTKLEKLYMRSNKISLITEKTFPKWFQQNATEIDFSRNPFSCTCDLLWFINWMKSNLDKFNKSLLHEYVCASPSNVAGIPLLNLTLSEYECLLGPNEKIITLATSVLLIVFLVVGSVLYRYRWHIRYFIYMIRYSQRQEVDTGHYEYDAFVAYSTEDRSWVIKSMMPVLENNENLKLCVHDRDFMVGKLIVDNIVDGIEKSRKVIIVLSNNFAQSSWCQFELNLIQRHVLENGQRLLVVVLLEEIETRHVTKAMRAMLQTTTYLLWGEEEYARNAFFNRLRMLLKTGRPGVGKRRLSV